MEGSILEAIMTNIHVDQVGEMAVIECEGRFVRSDEAFRLRDAVTAQRNAHVIVLDLTEMRAIGGGGIGETGHVIMTTADDEATKAVLEEGGYTFIEGESILAEVDDRPGGMAALSRQLADAGVNIYGHLFLGRWGDRAMFAFVVDDPDRARPILERKQ